MKSNLAICLFLLSAAGSAIAAEPVVEFKGVPMGASESIFKARNPGFGCGPIMQQLRPMGDRVCINEKAEFGGANATIKAFFYANRLLFANVLLKTGDFETVVDALKIKFGEPTVAYESITTRLGLKLTNENLEWRIGKVVIDGKRYSGDIDTATISYHDSAGVDEYARRRDQHIKAGANAL